MIFLALRKLLIVETLAIAALAVSADVDPVDVDDASSALCGPHELFDACTGCEANCTNPGPVACPKICIRPGRCRCAQGYARAPDGDCVKPEECPGSTAKPNSSTSSPAPVCGLNEFFDPCTGCEGDCNNLGLIACAAICISPGRCRCIVGYVRSPDGDCVKPDECPGSTRSPITSTLSPKCPDYEYVNDCGGCDGTCREPNPPCPEICGPAECRCIEGYVRRRGRCVPLENCRRRRITPCALVRCGWGQRCVVIRGRAVCVGTRQEEDPCALIDCMDGKVCKVQGGRTVCVDSGTPTNPCAAVLCPENTRCEVVPIACFVAPCPPGEAMCLPIEANAVDNS